MNNEVRNKLIEIAKLGRLLTYSEVNRECKLDLNFDLQCDRAELGRILGNISIHENDNDRPMLSAVVTIKGQVKPSFGFYNLAEKLGLLSYNENKDLFWAREVKKVFEYWRIDEKGETD